MHRKRRSGRVAKELPIVLLGTDTTGKVFAEQTKTVVLSRHGAGIVSRYRFTPDEVLTLRLPDSTKEAEIRLVGQMGGEPGRYVYGVAFVDPELLFWPMEFPLPEPVESANNSVTLECSLCHARREVEQHDIEEDVYSVNGNVLRSCDGCGTTTPWKKAESAAAPALAATPLKPPLLSFPQAPNKAGLASASLVKSLESPMHSFTLPASATLVSEPAYSSSFEPPADVDTSSPTYSESALETLPTAALAVAVADASMPAHTEREQNLEAKASAQTAARLFDSDGRRINRRRHLRIRVNYSACVRHPAHADEIVECENVSKGGLCFHSQQKYSVGSLIEVAAPYSPGQASLFVRAQIKRVETLPGDVFRYGAAYVKPA